MSEREPGWYPHPSVPGEYGYWDGRQWGSDTRKEPPGAVPAKPKKAGPDPWSYIVVGVVMSFVGFGWLLSNQGSDDALWFGWILLGLGSVLGPIGIIGVGVSIGYRHARATLDDE